MHAEMMDDAPAEQLRAEFRRLASGCGEPKPTDLKYVFSTFQIADTAVYGARTHANHPVANRPVVVITGRGSFVAPRRPKGFAPHTGEHLTGIWLHPDGEVVAYSISQREPELSALGSLINM
ncbi:MAG: hypothetical protein ACRDWT_04835 [Jatrophihabitantaceae bacterium]